MEYYKFIYMPKWVFRFCSDVDEVTSSRMWCIVKS